MDSVVNGSYGIFLSGEDSRFLVYGRLIDTTESCTKRFITQPIRSELPQGTELKKRGPPPGKAIK